MNTEELINETTEEVVETTTDNSEASAFWKGAAVATLVITVWMRFGHDKAVAAATAAGNKVKRVVGGVFKKDKVASEEKTELIETTNTEEN